MARKGTDVTHDDPAGNGPARNGPVRNGAEPAVTSGPARIDRRTKNLTSRLQPGDVAIIDHEDLDRLAAEGLLQQRVGAVVNVAQSLSGRYPNVGPLLVAAAGIPLLDGVGPEVMERVAEGEQVRVQGEEIWLGGVVVGRGVRQDLHSLERDYEAAKRAVGDELERFASNTLEYMQREHHLAFATPDVPDLDVDVKGRHVLVVVRGNDYREDLATLRSYVREMHPVLVAVDGGADALLDFGFRPHVIIGDFDSVSTGALHSGAQLVVHAYPGGEAPGAARLDALGLAYTTFEAGGMSEDVAMLLAYEKGAQLIVAVGAHGSMVEFLAKGRSGMASTFITRLKVGQLLVDAKGVSQLYQNRLRKRDVLLFLLAVTLCFVVVGIAFVPRVYFESVWLLLREVLRSITH